MIKCNNCKSGEIAIKYILNDSLTNLLVVMQCNNCGLRFSYPPPKHDYGKNYFTNEYKEYFISNVKDYDQNNRKVKDYIKGLKLIEKYTMTGNILDVGCGLGVFLDICGKRNWKCCGVDISNYASTYARKEFCINVRQGELKEMNFSDKVFDAISMWDSIEHVENPFHDLCEARRILKDNGVLFISTFNESSLLSSCAGFIYDKSFGKIIKPVKIMHPHHHITHFSIDTIKSMLDNAGFEVLESKTTDMPIGNSNKSFFQNIIIGSFYIIQKIFNRGLITWVVAGKKQEKLEE